MPKMIGNRIEGAALIVNNANACGTTRVRLSFSQAIRLPASEILASLDTTDRGSKGSLAKRWYRWFASADAIEACARSTPNMWAKATRARKLKACPLAESRIEPIAGGGNYCMDSNRYTPSAVGIRVPCVDRLGAVAYATHPIGGELHVALECAFAALAGSL